MGYEYYCLVPTGKDIGKQALLGLRIEGACCFIEQHDGTVAKQCPGYTDALCLSLAQSSSLLRAMRVYAIRKVIDKICTAQHQGLSYFLIRGILPTHLQIIAYGSAHQRIALWHIHEISAQQWCHEHLLQAIVYFNPSFLR